MERCDKKENEYERNTMKWIWCCVGLGLCSLWVCACVVDGKEGERVIDSGWWYNGRES